MGHPLQPRAVGAVVAAAVVAAAAVVLGACGSGESDEERVERLAEQLVEESSGDGAALSEEQAGCVAAALVDTFGADGLDAILEEAAVGDDDGDVRTRVVDAFSDCDALGPVLDAEAATTTSSTPASSTTSSTAG